MEVASPTRRALLGARAATVVAVVLAALAPAPSAAAVGAVGSAGCANADADPQAAPHAAVRDATLCLLNVERRQRGRRGLRHNWRLARAATRHAGDMVRRGYFAHDSLEGLDFVDRILRTGYVVRNAAGWVLGENLAWGSGDLATPREIVRAWMESPGHRRNILARQFRHVGIGIVLGSPVDGVGPAATYATEFGAR